ncbi:max-binding protein MNT-like [Cylas formicarius]|uniref:max-binding protein MNT-like n=1 Tax=Cylas formicarius TaxID=197179 RepID=UPI002958596B|nr:max-binding protein MNT-like [Cylas formicarius]XP_060534406.1 max-binding protein MNT-like [Cylas formicarius]XP_060534408.1 max-binding protein MNT-like [Cylas formicarius]
MSLNTLIEAARFLELQEQQQQHHRATLETALSTIRPVAGNGGQLQNGQNGIPMQTITLQPVKTVTLNNAAITSPGVAHQQQPIAQPTQTVVISSNNISSTLLQGPISFSTASSPTTSSPSQLGSTTQFQQNKKIEQDGHISSTTLPQNQRHRVLNNSFDIMNPLVIDESASSDQKKLKQPPMVFRSGTREVHNKLEKHRRAHLKECFDILKKQLPSNGEEKKTSNLSILHSALRYIQSLKRRERELEHEMERLAREKIGNQQRLAVLKKEIALHYDNVDFSKILPDIVPGTSTASSEQVSSRSVGQMNAEGQSDATIHTESNGIAQKGGNTVIATNGDKVAIPILSKTLPIQAPVTTIKEVTQPVQTAGISVLPMTYPVNQGLVLQKVAIVPHKGLTDLTPLVSTHFITTPQQLNGINGQINGKVVPLTQYLVKPVVVVSTASPRPGS